MNRLEKHVKEWLDEQSEDGYNSAGDDLLQYGCQSGMVGHLIYYVDTVAFYEKYQYEIDELLSNLLLDTGLSIQELFGDKWDNEDPLARDASNQNLLAWFGFEETARQLIEQ
jgi:hypothetical protein